MNDEITEKRNDSNHNKISERNYATQLENLNIYNLIKSDKLRDKFKSLELLEKYFNSFDNFKEKYETLLKIKEEIIPLLLNISMPSLSHEKNIKNIEVYISTGKFLIKFLFNKEYIFDFTNFINPKNEEKKYPCLFFYNKAELIDFSELNNNRYNILFLYDILKEYSKDLLDLYINYFIKQMIIYDTNFEIQYIIYEMLKYLYFLCDDEDSKNIFIQYIPEILNNLSLFKKEDEYNKSLNSREFGYYLLLNDIKFKQLITSLTISPKNEYDIYTRKFNIALELLNYFYIKREIKKGKSFEIIQKMTAKYSILYLEFYIEDNKDISLTIYKKNENDKQFEQIGYNNVIKTIKIEKNCYKIAKIIVINTASSNEENKKFSYINEFKIVFDNFDSWFTNKIIHYSISLFDKIEI